MKILNDKNYNELITNTSKIILIYFKTSTCPACSELEPIINKLEETQNDIEVYTCYLDKGSDKINNKYEIRGVPFTVFVNENKELKYPEVGVKDIGYFISKIDILTKRKKFFGLF